MQNFILSINEKTFQKKTQQTFCHTQLDTLQVALKGFLLKENEDYNIQVQAISTAGDGVWSSPIRYHVPTSYCKLFFLRFLFPKPQRTTFP
jgi:hypothetical protein